MAITAPAHWDANGVVASELARIAGREVAILFVGGVALPAVHPVVAFLRLVDALLAVGAAEFVQSTRSAVCKEATNARVT